MRQCGLSFGDRPVSGFIWRAVASMRSPIDYVARLSLTFEQANLDYARHFASAFREAGDERSARVLDRVYRDEIEHVRHGWTWFRRWKKAGVSDWDAFSEILPFPLSPARAKGIGFNAEGRRRAGLGCARS